MAHVISLEEGKCSKEDKAFPALGTSLRLSGRFATATYAIGGAEMTLLFLCSGLG
jgi:hypothetical protein